MIMCRLYMYHKPYTDSTVQYTTASCNVIQYLIVDKYDYDYELQPLCSRTGLPPQSHGRLSTAEVVAGREVLMKASCGDVEGGVREQDSDGMSTTVSFCGTRRVDEAS